MHVLQSRNSSVLQRIIKMNIGKKYFLFTLLEKLSDINSEINISLLKKYF
jgi:hypothetical protein